MEALVTVELQGREVVSPTLGNERELVAKLEDYLLADNWFDLDEQGRKDLVRKRDDCKCLICGADSTEVHEIVTKGSASAPRALVPWNMITVCREHHELLQPGIWTIYHFDPLDVESGLIVFDAGRHRVKDMWFYDRPNPELLEECHEDRQWLQQWASERMAHDWEAAVRLSRLKMNQAWKHLGEPSMKALVAGTSFDTGYADSLRNTFEKSCEFDVQDVAVLCRPEWAAKILKAAAAGKELPGGLRGALVAISGMSATDFGVFYDEHVRGTRHKKRVGVNKGADCVYQYEIEPGDPDPEDYDWVIEGHVVKGKVGGDDSVV